MSAPTNWQPYIVGIIRIWTAFAPVQHPGAEEPEPQQRTRGPRVYIAEARAAYDEERAPELV